MFTRLRGSSTDSSVVQPEAAEWSSGMPTERQLSFMSAVQSRAG